MFSFCLVSLSSPLNEAVLEGEPGIILQAGLIILGLVADDIKLLLLLLVHSILVEPLHIGKIIDEGIAVLGQTGVHYTIKTLIHRSLSFLGVRVLFS